MVGSTGADRSCSGSALLPPGGSGGHRLCSNLVKLSGSPDKMGPWRSLVAHLHGMQGVRGSNPLGSTKSPVSGAF